jgi:hypothetical protein
VVVKVPGFNETLLNASAVQVVPAFNWYKACARPPSATERACAEPKSFREDVLLVVKIVRNIAPINASIVMIKTAAMIVTPLWFSSLFRIPQSPFPI